VGWIHKAFVSAPSQSGVTKPKDLNKDLNKDPTKDIPMSISSVIPTLVVKAPELTQWKAPEPKTADDADTRGVQPKVQAPLPPGQGTRIDQLA